MLNWKYQKINGGEGNQKDLVGETETRYISNSRQKY
jgi:hypothetical protein